MILTWYPDFCPAGGRCAIETDQGQNNLIRFARLCSHHQGLADGGLSHDQVFRAIRNTTSAKERARWALKLDLGLDKEHPGLPYRVEPNGDITILSGAPASQRARLQNVAAQAAAGIERVPGISNVVVE
jgi:hypothetical protein